MDIGAGNWNENDNNNNSASPDGAPEGMAPSGVNDTIRAMMGATKRWYNWSTPKTTAGTSTAYTLSYTVAPGVLIDGMSHLVGFDQANGAAATLNVNSLGAQPLHYYSAGAWRVAPPGLLGTNTLVKLYYHSSSGAYRMTGLEKDQTGVMKSFAGATVPAGYLLCYGQAVSRTTYAGLFAALSTTFGVGDGSTTFNLPDMRGRVAAGKSDMGGSDAGNLAGGGVLGAGLGSQSNTAVATVSGSASGTLFGNTYTGADVLGQAPQQGIDVTAVAAPAHGHLVNVNGSLSVTASGTSGAFSIVQPSRVLNQIIAI